MSQDKYITPVSNYFPIHPRGLRCPGWVAFRAWLWKPPASKHHRMTSIVEVRGVSVQGMNLPDLWGSTLGIIYDREGLNAQRTLTLVSSSSLPPVASQLTTRFLSFSFSVPVSFAPFDFLCKSSHCEPESCNVSFSFGIWWNRSKEYRDQFPKVTLRMFRSTWI